MYNPYSERTIDVVEFSGLTHNPNLHASGVKWESPTVVSIVIDAGAAFNTYGSDVTGEQYLVKYDVILQKEVYRANFTRLTHQKFGGFQDVEYNNHGDAFVVGTFPSSLVRLSGPNGYDMEVWYGPNGTAHQGELGLSGLAAIKEKDILISNAYSSNELFKFKMSDKKGHPVKIPITPAGTVFGNTDGIRLHPKYNNKILLVARNDGGVAVFRSKDGEWNQAEYLGSVANPTEPASSSKKARADGFGGQTSTQSIQISNSIYVTSEFFQTNHEAGDQSEFPMGDITAAVEKLFGNWTP